MGRPQSSTHKGLRMGYRPSSTSLFFESSTFFSERPTDLLKDPMKSTRGLLPTNAGSIHSDRMPRRLYLLQYPGD